MLRCDPQKLRLHASCRMRAPYNSSIMRNSNFYAAQSTFDFTLSDEWCSGQPSSPYLVDACTSQLDELPWALPDTFVGQAIARYNLPNDFLCRSSEVSTTAFATAVNVDANSTQILSSDCVSRRQATPTSPSCSDMSLDGPSCAPKCESSSGQHTTRIPHNMVERKYRDGLNAQLERLRRAVPALLQSDDGDSTSQPRPSKSMVIAAAINYIETVTLERDMLQAENNKIGSSKGRRGSKRRRVNPASGSTVS